MKHDTRHKHVRRRKRLEELRLGQDGYPLRTDQSPKLHADGMTAQDVSGIRVTDHAVLRYLERVHKVDIRAVRESMLADGRAELVRQFRSGKFPVGEGCRLIVQDCVVVTVHTKEGE